MPKSAIIFIADGTEETEAITIADLLVRAGIKVTLLGVGLEDRGPPGIAKCSRGIKVVTDELLENIGSAKLAQADLLVLPGGAKGAQTLSSDGIVLKAIKTHFRQDKLLGMICAGSLCAKAAGLKRDDGNGKLSITSHPSVKGDLVDDFDYKEDVVVDDGNLITA